MRWGSFLLLGIFFSGCASKPAAPVPPAPVAQAAESVYDRAATASALMYDPPVAVNAPRIDVSRDGRAQAAFAGYEELTVTQFYLFQDDRQQNYGGWNNDRFERRAITQKASVTYR